jgi:sec-independent protein translocase protein TatA
MPQELPEAKGARLMIEGFLQPSHLLLILVVGVFAFGPKKLPELGKGLAQGIRSFRDGIKVAEHSAAPEIEKELT